jgi:N-methylhydantoinase B
VLLNDPFRGGTHLPDLTLVSPVFVAGRRGRRPDFFVATRAHHADVGGAEPGSMAPCRDLYGEGLVIPPIVLERDGRFVRDALRMILANVRTPDERRADLTAQCAANRRGVARVGELARKYGARRLARAAAGILDHGERVMRALLAKLPAGRYRHEERLDDDGMGTQDVPIRVELRLRRASSRGPLATIDFTGTAPQVDGSLNANPAITLSAVLYCFQCLAAGTLPPNEGMARPLRVVIPEGSLLRPRPGAAVAGGNVETSQRIVDAVLGALAKAAPRLVPAASQGTMNNLTLGSSSGPRPFAYYETVGGGAGASALRAGASGLQVHMTNTLNTPIEALELAYPLRVTRSTLARGSGGAGARRGGDGIEREIETLVPARVALLSERRRHAPPGLAGGGAGSPGSNWIVQKDVRRAMASKFVADLAAGDRVGQRTPGGGGFGRTRATAARRAARGRRG